jgi:hypothetical protein
VEGAIQCEAGGCRGWLATGSKHGAGSLFVVVVLIRQNNLSLYIIYIYIHGKNICWNSLLLCFMVLAIIIVSLQWNVFFLRFSPSTIELVLAWIDDFGSHNGWFTLM